MYVLDAALNIIKTILVLNRTYVLIYWLSLILTAIPIICKY